MRGVVRMNQDEFFAFLRKHLGDVLVEIDFPLDNGKAVKIMGDLTKPPFKYEDVIKE